MTVAAQELLDRILALPERERAEIAYEALASIEHDPAAGSEAEWAGEIERRARRALAGQSQGHEWSRVRDEIEAELREATLRDTAQ